MPTRISGACNACRSKKQKCSGDKSGCAQCETAGITCTWPEQRKRGPAKGYIEGLEHRLHDAEYLLLQLLPHISTEQLQAASSSLANQDGSDPRGDSPDRRSSPPLLNKKTGIEYWENFPLTSVASIRRWQLDCETNSSGQARSGSMRPDARGSSPASHMLLSESGSSKRRSLPLTSVSPTYPGTDTSLDGPLRLPPSRRTSSQGIPPRQEHAHMSMNQQAGSWQTQMMNMDPAQNDITQQQMFTNVGYLNPSGAWTQQQQQQHQRHPQQIMAMEIDHQHAVAPNTVPGFSTQAHSHLFW